MPKPNKGETKDEYLQRCMGDSEMQKYSLRSTGFVLSVIN